ncbi:helix-turn-helix domain-containing protein [Hafnia alvei]|uniref:helix-turn-helix domain-containing protein n=1 Tax=Hafnia alvei TaxID=569 RepID=UPI0010354C66|nr:helix-turn-helix domain-containing protein [Hafnia alvei]TBM25059.1 helix-turn-helix domain-containing protein [Hafnia alvei]
MSNVNIQARPVLINRENVQKMLGGISRTTFYRRRKEWTRDGRPFPSEVQGVSVPKGGTLYRYDEVIQFCQSMGISAAQE